MIDEIQVQNLALIRSASFAPGPGLTAVTGETGAGKTALLSALKLLMGARASADMVRDDEGALAVSGRFFGLARPLDGEDEDDLPAAAPDGPGTSPDDEIVVSRRIGADGRSRAAIDGVLASVRELAQLVGPSVDLCGQFEHQQLMRTATHGRLLDAWAAADVAAPAKAYAEAFAAAALAHEERERVRAASELSASKLEEARYALARIDEVDPQEGEYDEIKRDLDRAEHAESLARAVQGAHEALSGDAGALDAIGSAAGALESVARIDPALGDLAASLREACYVLEDVAATARDYAENIEFDAGDLMRKQERISSLQGLMRAFGPTMDDVAARRAQAAEAVALVDDADARLQAADAACAAAEAALDAAADALDAARERAIPSFERAVGETMARLEMGGAAFVCAMERLPRESWTAAGPSSIEFLYRPGAGLQPRPLARIASGGEVSRMTLALKVALGASDMVDTLVFDEVDAGVGGATAVALAEVIADLAKTHQVIVVTHLAQVAVRADVHYVVERRDGTDGSPQTVLAPVEGAAREEEIARMLAGAVTDASRAHAREMLAG